MSSTDARLRARVKQAPKPVYCRCVKRDSVGQGSKQLSCLPDLPVNVCKLARARDPPL